MAYTNAALRQYQSFGAATATSEADPHKLIDMLLAGVIDRLASAKGCMQRGERPAKLQSIASAVAIIEHLRLHLDMSAGGDIAKNLWSLYEYSVRRLLRANISDDAAVLDEVISIFRELKAGWEAMPEAAAVRRH